MTVNPSTYACTESVKKHGFSADLSFELQYGTGWHEVDGWTPTGHSHLFLTGMT